MLVKLLGNCIYKKKKIEGQTIKWIKKKRVIDNGKKLQWSLPSLKQDSKWEENGTISTKFLGISGMIQLVYILLKSLSLIRESSKYFSIYKTFKKAACGNYSLARWQNISEIVTKNWK